MSRSRTPAYALLLLAFTVVAVGCAQSGPLHGSPDMREPELQITRAVMADGYSLPYSAWGPQDTDSATAVVLALHGFNDYHRSFEELAQRLASDGVVTYAYDQRSFGATAGRGIWPSVDSLVDDARTMLELVRRRHPQTPVYILGESMGGAVAINALTRDPRPEVAGSILVAPAVWARSTMPWYQRAALAIGARIAPSRTLTGEGLDITPTDNIELLREWSRDPLVIRATRIDAINGLSNLMDAALEAVPELRGRSLILYGENDQIIPARPTCRMLDALPSRSLMDWRFMLYPDGYHMLTRDLGRAIVHDDIVAWIRNPATEQWTDLERNREQALRKLCGR